MEVPRGKSFFEKEEGRAAKEETRILGAAGQRTIADCAQPESFPKDGKNPQEE